MYLKSIEAYGFKSFANKIEFNFNDGITGIVGPNGSGKSNIADALRWVLGEQSVKQLRGSNMQDVIFSGTENRKPLSYASVAITLDNSDHVLPIDYSEITITRKLYRSGESEYLINGTPCRLKDINEMFYDTGIGKEGYSIIGQGQIDKILSGRPEDRRELFDEAAGIVKYKRRKNITEKKLENERINLVRVNDILQELDKQITPLEEESVKAKQYLSLKEELRKMDINIFLVDTSSILNEEKQIEEKISYVDNDINKNHSDLDDIKKENEDVENYMEELTSLIDENKNKLNQSNILKGQLENQINILKEQINSSRNLSEHNIKRRDELIKELEDKKFQLKEIEEKQKVLKESIKDYEELSNNSQSKLEEIKNKISEINKEIEVRNSEIINEINKRSDSNAEIKKYETILEQKRIEKSNMANRLISLKSSEKKYEEELDKSKENLQKIQNTISEKNKEISVLNNDITKLKDLVDMRRLDLNNARQELEHNKTKLESIKDLTERYEGYGNSVRFIMEYKSEVKGIIGVVGDIISVDKKYEIAIETALASNIQNIVVEDEDTAKVLISRLKEKKAGRATFLPLTLSKKPHEFKYKDSLNDSDIIGIASDVVKCDERYRNIIDTLLGGIVIVNSIDAGIRISKANNSNFKIVTLDGEFFNTKGGISGGSYRNNNNLLGRARQIKELEKQIISSQKNVDDFINTVESLKTDRINKYKELENISNYISEIKIEESKIILNINSIESSYNEAKSNFEKTQKETLDIDSDLNKYNEIKDNINKTLNTSFDVENSLKNDIKSLEENILDLNNKVSSINSEIEESKIKHSSIIQEIEYNETTNERINSEIEDITHKLKELNETHNVSKDEITEKENNIKQIENVINESVESFKELENEIKEKEKEKEELNNKYKDYINKREKITNIINELEKEKIRLENNKIKLQERFDYKVNYMWDEYEISLDSARELKDDSLNDLSFMKNKSIKLKKEIKSLGNVNVNAIEDYKNVSQRHEFMQAQHDDLVESEAKLLDIINELDKEMKKQFATKFAEINKEYNKVFKDLFGGGKASLELLDESDLLESGIKIIAQPPGKKLQNMMQLSGGEKALTAISLLFAIQNLKPSPFCMLDEIEAALDDSNVVRFANYLTNMTKNTQFIVITHRRGTMQVADRLYGITMQEKGVSTLVSVDLVEKSLSE